MRALGAASYDCGTMDRFVVQKSSSQLECPHLMLVPTFVAEQQTTSCTLCNMLSLHVRYVGLVGVRVFAKRNLRGPYVTAGHVKLRRPRFF